MSVTPVEVDYKVEYKGEKPEDYGISGNETTGIINEIMVKDDAENDVKDYYSQVKEQIDQMELSAFDEKTKKHIRNVE